MTESEFKTYAEVFYEDGQRGLQTLAAKATALKKRQLTPEYKAAEAQIRSEVTDQFKSFDTLSQISEETGPHPNLKAVIDREVQSRLEAQFGGSLRNVALEHGYEYALQNRAIDLMTQEMQKLSERVGRPISLMM